MFGGHEKENDFLDANGTEKNKKIVEAFCFRYGATLEEQGGDSVVITSKDRMFSYKADSYEDFKGYHDCWMVAAYICRKETGKTLI